MKFALRLYACVFILISMQNYVPSQNLSRLPNDGLIKKSNGESLPDGYCVKNGALNLSIYFATHCVRIAPLTAGHSFWELQLNLARYGYKNDLKPVSSTEPVMNANHIEYRYPNMVEWYVSDINGLEQGFTLQHPPESTAQQTQLVLEIELKGNLTPKLANHNQTLVFYTESGTEVIRLANLYVYDATKRQLPAHFDIDSSKLLICMDVADAAFPVTVDPYFLKPDWFVKPLAGIVLGYSASSAGDVNGDGYSDIIVGAPGAYGSFGAAFVFYGSANGFKQIKDILYDADWLVKGNQTIKYIGNCVSTAGDVNGDGYDDVLIGTPDYPDWKIGRGAVFLFFGSKNGLKAVSDIVKDADWMAAGSQDGERFGTSVGPAGDINNDNYDDIIIGAPGKGRTWPNWTSDKGSVYVFYGSKNGLKKVNNVANDADWAVKSPQVQDFTCDFGRSVGSAGDVNGDGLDDIFIAAPGYPVENMGPYQTLPWEVIPRIGAVFVIHGAKNGLKPISDILTQSNWIMKGNVPGNNYLKVVKYGGQVSSAYDVDDDGYDDLMVNVRHCFESQLPENKVYLYHGGPQTLAKSPARIISGGAKYLSFGSLYAEDSTTLSAAGDIDSDGFGDIVIGAPSVSSSYPQGVFIFHGSKNGIKPVKNLVMDVDRLTQGKEASQDSWFAHAVSEAGDVNGDGYSDIIVGAPYNVNSKNSYAEGAVFVYYGSPYTECLQVPSSLSPSKPDQHEPNNNFSNATPISLTSAQSTKVSKLTLHGKNDVDIFKIDYQSTPDQECEKGSTSQTYKLGPVCHIEYSPGSLFIKVTEEKCNKLNIKVYNSAKKEILTSDPSYFNCPTTTFKDKKLFVSISNPFDIPLHYELSVAFAPSSMIGHCELLYEPPFPRWDFPGHLFGDPPVRYFDPRDLIMDIEEKIRKPFPFHDMMERAETYFEVARFAQDMKLYDEAENFYRLSADFFHKAGNPIQEAYVLRRTAELYIARGMEDKALEKIEQAAMIRNNYSKSASADDNMALGHVYLENNELSKSLSSLDKALAIQKHLQDKIGMSRNLLLQSDILLSLKRHIPAVACLILVEEAVPVQETELNEQYNHITRLVIEKIGETEFMHFKAEIKDSARRIREEAVAEITGEKDLRK